MFYKFKYVFGLILIVCLLAPCVFANNDLNFDLPMPANTRLLDTKELALGGRQINTTLFSSQEKASSLIDFYTDFFTARDFEKILDKSHPDGKKLLRFKKEDLVVGISITEKNADTEIVIAKFLQGPGELPPEKTKPSVKDSMFTLPASDTPGEDIANIPRPSPSVRITSLKTGLGTMVMYTTPLDVASTVAFYNAHMPDYGWQLLERSGIDEAVREHIKVSDKDSLGVQSPFSDGEDFEQVVRDSYVLSFSSGAKNAEIVIFHNFLSRKLGSIVQVSYSEPQQ